MFDENNWITLVVAAVKSFIYKYIGELENTPSRLKTVKNHRKMKVPQFERNLIYYPIFEFLVSKNITGLRLFNCFLFGFKDFSEDITLHCFLYEQTY